MLAEDRNVREIPLSTYKSYLAMAKSTALGSTTIIAFASAFAIECAITLYLGVWVNQSFHSWSQQRYMAVWAMMGAALAVIKCVGSICGHLLGLRASSNMFEISWTSVIRAPAIWHDRTPTGRILNRLSKDISALDEGSILQLVFLMSSLMRWLGSIAVLVYNYPIFALLPLPAGYIVQYTVSSLSRTVTRETGRLSSLVKSVIQSEVNEQIRGLSILRVFRQEAKAEERLLKATDREIQVDLVKDIAVRWATPRIFATSCGIELLLGLVGLLLPEALPAAIFGAVFVYASQGETFQHIVNSIYNSEILMNSVERVMAYTDLENEGQEINANDPSGAWPSKGEVTFNNVKLRYRAELPLVLKGLTFRIAPGEKVGIIGRTGAGKSSIAQAILRLVELSGGEICVDGKNLRELGLKTVRKAIATIPQESFLFGGTIRDNIDPEGDRSDEELNHLLDLVRNDPRASANLKTNLRLDGEVHSHGANFSAGEGQVLALLRAMARQCKLLVLDEATSSVDLETDALIQTLIATEFADVTLISIAHRLQTVAFYDRILVLDAGEVKEFETPLTLFDDTNSIFRSLCETRGLTREDIVRIQKEAADARQKRSNGSQSFWFE